MTLTPAPHAPSPVPPAAPGSATPSAPPAAAQSAAPSAPPAAPPAASRLPALVTAVRRGPLAAQLRGALADAAPRTGYVVATYVVGVLLLVSGVVHAGVWAVDGGAWEGAVSWRKPILFGVSFGLFALAAGWVQTVLPPSRLWGWSTTVLMAAGAVGEVGLITAQQWRGTPSHFNVLTPVDTAVFALMGVTIAVFGVGVVLLTVWVALRLRRPAPTVVAALVGLGLVLAASALGGDLMTRGMAYVEANDAVPSAVVLGAAGSGKLAHAVALHGIQVLGVLALLLGRSALGAAAQTRAMAVSATGYVALAALVAAQAYAGRSLLELPADASVAIALAAVAAVAPFGWALARPIGDRPGTVRAAGTATSRR
jgi:hypothetical protein